jgi:hypothetical protein
MSKQQSPDSTRSISGKANLIEDEPIKTTIPFEKKLAAPFFSR